MDPADVVALLIALAALAGLVRHFTRGGHAESHGCADCGGAGDAAAPARTARPAAPVVLQPPPAGARETDAPARPGVTSRRGS